MTAVQAPADAAFRCPQCGGEIGDEQEWCLRCGRGARTRVLRARHWRVPIVLAGVLVALSGAGLAVLFVALSGGDAKVVTSGELTTTVTVTTAAPGATAPPATAPTAPPATTPTSPGASTPGTPTAPTTPPAATPTAPPAATTPAAPSTGSTTPPATGGTKPPATTSP